MTLKRRSSGAWTPITTTYKKRVSGAWVNIGAVYRRLTGAWVLAQQWYVKAVTALVSASASSQAGATAYYRLNTSGNAESRTGGSGYSTIGAWLLSGASSDYEVRVTKTTDTTDATSGTYSTWVAANTSPIWYATMISSGTTGDMIATLELRLASSGTILDSTTITLRSTYV